MVLNAFAAGGQDVSEFVSVGLTGFKEVTPVFIVFAKFFGVQNMQGFRRNEYVDRIAVEK